MRFNCKKQICRLAVIVGMTVFALAGVGCAGRESTAEKTEETKTTPFPEFTSVDLEGNTVDQSVFGDKKLTMVNVWATYCSPCLEEMPDLGELAEEYSENFQILGLVSDVFFLEDLMTEDTLQEAKEIVELTKANYTHVVTSESLLSGLVSQVSAVPTTFFVDGAGNVLGVGVSGARTKEKWQQMIEALLEQVQE